MRKARETYTWIFLSIVDTNFEMWKNVVKGLPFILSSSSKKQFEVEPPFTIWPLPVIAALPSVSGI